MLINARNQFCFDNGNNILSKVKVLKIAASNQVNCMCTFYFVYIIKIEEANYFTAF